MPNSRVLTGEVRNSYLVRVRSDINRAAVRLGFPVGTICGDLSHDPETVVFSGNYIKCESGVWACDATIYVKYRESDQAK